MKLSDSDLAYLDGLLSAYDELPDGAWQTACTEAIRADKRFKDRDPNDVWVAWMEPDKKWNRSTKQ